MVVSGVGGENEGRDIVLLGYGRKQLKFVFDQIPESLSVQPFPAMSYFREK